MEGTESTERALGGVRAYRSAAVERSRSGAMSQLNHTLQLLGCKFVGCKQYSAWNWFIETRFNYADICRGQVNRDQYNSFQHLDRSDRRSCETVKQAWFRRNMRGSLSIENFTRIAIIIRYLHHPACSSTGAAGNVEPGQQRQSASHC